MKRYLENKGVTPSTLQYICMKWGWIIAPMGPIKPKYKSLLLRLTNTNLLLTELKQGSLSFPHFPQTLVNPCMFHFLSTLLFLLLIMQLIIFYVCILGFYFYAFFAGFCVCKVPQLCGFLHPSCLNIAHLLENRKHMNRFIGDYI